MWFVIGLIALIVFLSLPIYITIAAFGFTMYTLVVLVKAAIILLLMFVIYELVKYIML